MKTILIIALFSFTFCVPGGWEKRSVYENDIEIEKSFSTAFKDYSETNKETEVDDIIRLTVYSQVVSGNKYKITFIDSQAENPTVQEYEIYKPIDVANGPKFQITEHKEYESSEDPISENDSQFVYLQNKLYDCLKMAEQKLNDIYSINPIENKETIFYIINADTSNGEHQYIMIKDKDSTEFEFELIK